MVDNIVVGARRERAKRVARMVAGKLPNGPTAGLFRNASNGEDEDVLSAICLILESSEGTAI